MILSVSALLPADLRGLRFAALAALCLFGLSACSTFAKDEDPIVINDEPADKLYNEGLYLLNNGNYSKSTEKFKQLDQQHPYTEWARKAHLMEVYAHYKQGNYDDASIAGKRYLTLHPGSEDAAYAQYLVAMSNYNQIPDVTRDQKRTQEALQALEEVVRKWPDSEYAGEARKRITVARDQLAGKEMEIGRYYLNERNWTGAINRFKTVVTQHQTTRHVEEALARLAEAYMSLGIVGEAQTAAAVLGHNFPQSQWYKDTYKLMSSKGLEPRENKGSWISKAFKGIVG